MIRAAMVGIGRWGRTLVGSVQGKSDKFRFTAGYNRTRANAEAFCAEHGLKLADSLDEILADPEIDAVVFATPHSEHGAQVERAAAAGKHVFMEKPFTLDRQQRGAGARCRGAGRDRARGRLSAPLSSEPAGIESAASMTEGSARSRIAMPSRTRRPGCSWTRARGAPTRQRRRPAA